MISELVQKFVIQHQRIKEIEEETKNRSAATNINVDEVAIKVAAFYEKIRKIVDWREEHLMRRVAIKRIIKRRKFLGGNDNAEEFVIELIRGGHFPNGKIERIKIKEVKKILGKYQAIINKAQDLIIGKKSLFWSEVLDIASCEIEEALDEVGHTKTNALIELMENSISPRIIIGKRANKNCPINAEQKKEFIYVAIQQALFNLDEQLIYYNLLKKRNSGWREENESEQVEVLLKQLVDVLNEYEDIVNHPLFNKFYKICEQYDTPFLIIGDIVNQNPNDATDIFDNENSLRLAIRKNYEKRLEKIKGKSRRSAVYSTISVFLGNIISLYALEIPFTLYIMGSLNPWAQILTVILPTLLMLFLVTTIKSPSVNNYRLVIDETKKIVAGDRTIYEAEIFTKKKLLFKILSFFVYFLSICICGFIYGYFLYYFKYPPLSSFLFVAFTALIMFAGIKIRRRARELEIEPEKEGFISLLKDLFSLPVVRLGKWLSNYWKKYNIVSITFNFLVELPFMTFINFIENWRDFIKEKKEDIH